MIRYIVRRIIIIIPLMAAISVMTFTIIQLPPGNYVSVELAHLVASSRKVLSDAEIQRVRMQLIQRYGLDRPGYIQYLRWIRNILASGNFGYSFAHDRPVIKLILERLPITIILNLATMSFVWFMALPVGIVCAIRQRTAIDYFWSFVGFIGLATPNFILALIAMWLLFSWTGTAVIGLFSDRYAFAPWSIGKVIDLLKHMWIPVIIIGTAGTASMIRLMRNLLLDELRKPYVTMRRAIGHREIGVLRAPVKISLNPFISMLGFMLPSLVSGEVLVSIVLNLPTTGPLLLNALMNQDMYLAGGILLILSSLTVAGSLMSDLLLVFVDPRIRYEGKT